MGTAVGAKVFNSHGWRPTAALNLAWTGFTLLVLLLRGPHCKRYTWLGWEGGCELRKSKLRAGGGDGTTAPGAAPPPGTQVRTLGDVGGADSEMGMVGRDDGGQADAVEEKEKAEGNDEKSGGGDVHDGAGSQGSFRETRGKGADEIV